MPGMNLSGKPRTEKEKLKARQAAFSDVDNKRVAQAISQSQNGFKGQQLNDHGLPAGRADIIQDGDANQGNGAKFRKQKYGAGTNSIVVGDPRKKKGSTMAEDEAANEKPTPMKLTKVETPSVPTDDQMDEVAKTIPAYKNPTIDPAKAADMEKVRQHQIKLNKYGANLKVDGMWGAKTEAASRDLYPKYKNDGKPVVKKAPISDSRMQGLFGSSGKEVKTTKASSTATVKNQGPSSNQGIPISANGAPVSATVKANNDYIAKTQKEVDAYNRKADTTLTRRRNKVANNDTSADPNTHLAGSLEEGRVGAQVSHDIIGAVREHNLSVAEEEKAKMDAANGAKKVAPSGKGLDKTDGAIYASEAVGPAIGRRLVKSKSMLLKGLGAAAMVGPTLADIAKTEWDDDFKTPVKSALKATARGVVLGTAGSMVAGGLRRTAKGLAKQGKEAKLIKGMTKDAKKAFSAAENEVFTAKNNKLRKVAETKLASARADLKTAKSLKITPTKSLGENMNKAFRNTGAGWVADKAVNNSVVKGAKNVMAGISASREQEAKLATRKAKDASKFAKTGKTIAEAQEEHFTQAKEKFTDARLAKEGEEIATRNAAREQAKIDAEHAAANDAKIKTGGKGGTTIKGNGKMITSSDVLARESEAKVKTARQNIAAKNKAEKLKVAEPIKQAREAVKPAKQKARMMRLKSAEERAIASTEQPTNKIQQFKEQQVARKATKSAKLKETAVRVKATREKATMKFKNKIKVSAKPPITGAPPQDFYTNPRKYGYRKVITGGAQSYVKI